MKVGIGDVIESGFGRGRIIVITKEWVVHDCGNGTEAALNRKEWEVWLPIEEVGPEGSAVISDVTIDLEVGDGL